MRVTSFLLVAILVGSMGAGPAAKPTSKPTASDTPAAAEARAKVAAARAALDAAKTKAVAAFDASVGGKPLAAQVASAQKALDQARATGTPQEKLDASSAFVSAKKALDDARAKAVAGSPEVRSAEAGLVTAAAAVARSQAQAEAERKAAEDKEKNDPIKAAIRKHQIVKGMTDEQMQEAMRFRANPSKSIWTAERSLTEEDEVTISVWHIGYSTQYSKFQEVRTVRVWSKGGVVEKVTQTRDENFDIEPEN